MCGSIFPVRIGISDNVYSTRAANTMAAIVVAWAAGFWLYRKAPKADAPAPPGNPIAILPAIGSLVFVAIAAVAARWAQGSFGQSGLAVLLLIIGSMDVDVAIVTLGGLPAAAIGALPAAMAIAGTIIINMAVKIGITLVYAGRREFRRPRRWRAALSCWPS